MKRKLTFVLTALLLLTGMTSWGQLRTEVTDVLNREFTGVTGTTYTSWSDKTSNSDAVYAGQSAGSYESIQLRSSNSNSGIITTASGGTVTKVEVTWNSNTANGRTLNVYGSNAAYTSPTELYNSETQGTLIGTIVNGTSTVLDISDSYTFIGLRSASGAMYLEEIDITWTTGGSPQQTVAAPTFSPAGGTYTGAQTVTLACATNEATIYYTLDGSIPTVGSTQYDGPLYISETTTVKAFAAMTGMNNSAVATATYTIVEAPSLITIAEARALEVNEYALVQGVVTFIDAKNVYIQDETAAIDLFLNANAPSSLALGDKVQAYGKRAVYRGLVELSGINATDSNQFSVISTGNTLPLAVKTIAEVVAGGADALQCTRVKIESATIGTINTSGNTPLTQGENSINIYKVPALTDIEAGDVVDVTAVVGFFDNPQLRVAYATDVVLATVSNPVLNVSVDQLSGFQYIYGSGPSQPKNFTLSGSDLTANVVVTAPQDFEVSLNANGSYSNSLTIAPSEGSVAKTVYVRMKAGLNTGSHTGNVNVTCGNLSQSVALSGTVSEQPVAEAPTFSPVGGTYLTAQTVTLSTTITGAIIYYTLNGSTPTVNSTAYSQPIVVSTTTTIKAIVVASGYQTSAVAEATYTINEPMTIAQARALADNAFACVEGTVIFIDGRNVYIQDETAGIDLYLNTNTVPTNLALGNKVRAYGSKTVFRGLVELSGINGGDANVFSILSTGNPLPLAIKTIAEINTDFGSTNLLQSTRVKIEDAVVGAINPSETTVISQNGNDLNVFHIPNVPGMVEGDLVTITGVISCYNNPQLRVVSANDVEFGHRPILTANLTSLSGLNYEYESGGPSEIASFLVSGNHLTGNVAVYPSENFEVSTIPGENFHLEDPAMIFIPNTGYFYDINVYVRLKANLEVGTYNEQIYAVSGGADTLFLNVSGTVTGSLPPTPPAPTTDDYVRISNLSQLVAGSQVVFAARFNENATEYCAMSNIASGKPSGVLFISTINEGNEILPASIVNEENNFYWTVSVTSSGYTFTNAAGHLIGWESSTNFSPNDNTEWSITLETAGESAMVPGYNGFVISNVYNSARCFALNSNHNFGPYNFTTNNNSSGYNFYLDLFVKTGGIEPPMPTVATPTFSPEAGTYVGEQTVTINCATQGARIWYTTDGSDPIPMVSQEYDPTEPIPVSEGITTIKAIATMVGYNNSDPASATYIIQPGSTTTVTIFNQDWEEDWHGWTEISVVGDNFHWNIASYQGNHYASMNGYSQGAYYENEDWLISPAFNLDSYNNVVLTFRTATKFDGDTLKVYFSNNYDSENPDFSESTWSLLDGFELSQGNYVWVESGPIHLDPPTYTGTNCYIAFKYTCSNEAAAAWEVDDIMLVGQTSTTEPVVNVTPLSLSGFTYIEGNGPSIGQHYFTVSGFNLSGNITVYAATDYEIRRSDGGFTLDTIVLDPANGIIEDTIYVQLKAGLAVGEYNNEIITLTSADVDDIYVTCSGNVTAQPVTGGDYVRINNVSELVDGNRIVFAARFDENATDYIAMSNLIINHPSGMQFTSVLNGSEEILPASIINEEDNFYWTVNVTADGYTFTNANGELLGHSTSTNFAPNGENTAWSIEIGTSEGTAMVPNYTGFVVGNVNDSNRAFALNGNHYFGAYHLQNIAGENYNFFLDIFMQGEGGPCTVAAPTFNPTGGTYYDPIEVALNSTTQGATVYYSLVSEPYDWWDYQGPILVDSSMTIWAYAENGDCDPSPVVYEDYIIQNDLTIIFNQDWEEQDWHGWTEVCQQGDSLWHIGSYQGNHFANANGYNHDFSIDWLISPAFDLNSVSNAVLTFRTAKGYEGDTLGVFFSSNYEGDPADATWERLICPLSTGNFTWVESGDILLSENFSGANCHIGFMYTNNIAASWEVDDIMLVASGSAIPTPTLTATPNSLSGFSYVVGHGPSDSLSYILTGTNLDDVGNIQLTVNGDYFEILQGDGTYGDTLSISYTEGHFIDTIYVRMVEGLEASSTPYMGNINHAGGGATTDVSLSGIVRNDNEPNLAAAMPLYIQGNNGSNSDRVPVAVQVTLLNLEPNTTYRYTNQFVDSNDGPETAGAGNVIYVNDEGFYRTTSPSLATEGDYGEFTTSANGSQILWFMNEPTGNPRFTPGNHVYLRIRINDGHDGTEVANTFTTASYATVLSFGTENDEYSGSAFYVKSNEAPMGFALLYTDVNHMERPVYSTSIETTGVDYGSINQYADFYKELVAGKDGWFGGILPNVNETGINHIWIYDLNGGSVEYETTQGQWAPEANTVNPNAGLDDPIFIDLTSQGIDEPVEANVKVWSADHEFVVENGDDAHYTMTVYNVLGQQLMQHQINAGGTQRVSHDLVAGLYVISLQNNENRVAVKVIVR